MVGLANSKALLGKWLWRFPIQREALLVKVISSKYGIDEIGWDSCLHVPTSIKAPWEAISGLLPFHTHLMLVEVIKSDFGRTLDSYDITWCNTTLTYSNFIDVKIVRFLKANAY